MKHALFPPRFSKMSQGISNIYPNSKSYPDLPQKGMVSLVSNRAFDISDPYEQLILLGDSNFCPQEIYQVDFFLYTL